MKLKVVVSGYVGKKITGIGRNIICTLEETKSDNKYIIYCNYDMIDDFKFNNDNIIIRSYSVSKNSSLKNLLWTTFVFPFKVLYEHADVALIPNFTLLLIKFRPTIVIMTDLIEFNVPDKFSKLKMFYRTKIADPLTAKLASKIVTISESSKKDIIKYLNINEEKIEIIYSGVDRNKFKRIDKEKAIKVLEQNNLPTDFIMYAGTIDHPGKNAISVIRSFIKLKKEKNIKEKLILVGMPGKGYETVINEANNSEFKDEIIFTGYVDDDILISLYNVCKAFCFISLYEGFGIPPLEALACGSYVVVSNASSLPEIVGNAGLIVNPLDINEISNSIYAILNNSSVTDSLNNNIENQLNKFNWKDSGTKMDELVNKLVLGNYKI